ncbi:MAG: murein biosynthesis integral membrane protein MurJ [Candidatus Velthaea sp.]
MGATLASALIGFAREVINARYYGTQWEMDTFLAAVTIPTIVFGIFNGALLNALVPTFTDYFATGRDVEAWRLANTVLNALLIVLIVGAALGWLFAPVLVPLIAHGFPAPQMGVAVRMTRWLMPSIIATSLAGVVSAILNTHHKFRAAALQGIAINVVTIAAVISLDHRIGIYALVLGTTLGLCAQLFVQLPSFLAMGRYRWVIDLHHPGLRQIGTMLGPIIVGSAAGQLALLFDRFFASTLTPGYIAGMNYAVKLVGFPQQIFAAAIATVIFPLIASQFARQNRAGVRRSLTTGLRLVNFITIPAVFGLIALATPIVQTLFERGQFAASATQLCAGLLPFAAIGLVALAANIILTRCCFACNEVRWPVAISVAAVVLNIALSMLWLNTLGARGLLLANSVSQSMQAVALGILAWHLVGGLDTGKLLRSAGTVLVSSLAMVAALQWIATLHVSSGTTLASHAWYLTGQLFIAGAVFFAVAKLLGVEELDLATRLILEKFRTHVPSAPENRGAPIA